jgi:8-oxo-dGTP diphosphatase
MPIYLVRHAKAGDRSAWTTEDRLRPLSKKGQRQAQQLAERLAGLPVPLVPPTADAHGLAVVTTDVLAEGASFLLALELLESVPDHTVLCSHGDVIPETIGALYRRGTDVVGPEDWRKCATWVLERTEDGFASAATWPPPLGD